MKQWEPHLASLPALDFSYTAIHLLCTSLFWIKSYSLSCTIFSLLLSLAVKLYFFLTILMNRTLPCTILYQRAVEQLWIKRVILGECVDVFFVCWHLIGWLRTHYTRFSTWIDEGMLFPAILLASSSCTVFIGYVEGEVEHQPGGESPSWGLTANRH